MIVINNHNDSDSDNAAMRQIQLRKNEICFMIITIINYSVPVGDHYNKHRKRETKF